MLNSKQRAYLRAQANVLDPIFQIGKQGVTEELCRQLCNALEARELIKVKVLENSGYTAKEIGNAVADAVDGDCVAIVGNKFVLYKESEKKKRIMLP